MTQKVFPKLGVIGVGRMGSLHLTKLRKHSEIELVGFYDSNPTNAERVARDFQTKSFVSLTDLLFETDAVLIAAPTESHYQIAKQALDSGNHVLLEKPFCASLEKMRELVNLAKLQKLVFHLGLVERFRLKALLPVLGPVPNLKLLECQRLSPQVGRESSVDVIEDLMIHDLDLVLSLISQPIEEISAVGVNVISQKWDFASVQIKFLGPVYANLSSSRVASKRQRTMQLYSEGAAIHLDFIENTVHQIKFGSVSQNPISLILDPLQDQLHHFVQAIEAKENSFVSGEEGLRVLEVMHQIKNELENGMAQDRPYLEVPRRPSELQ